MPNSPKPIELKSGDVVLWKHEDESGEAEAVGPVVVLRGSELLNYHDSNLSSCVSGKPLPRWFSRREARKIAHHHGLEIREG